LIARGDFKRWLYRGQRPNRMARILNRAWAAVASTGVPSDYLVTLEVTGRKSGRIVALPLVMTVVDGRRYLVSMLGHDVQWVKLITYGQSVDERFSGAAIVRRSNSKRFPPTNAHPF
jgi:hypothetical protein